MYFTLHYHFNCVKLLYFLICLHQSNSQLNSCLLSKYWYYEIVLPLLICHLSHLMLAVIPLWVLLIITAHYTLLVNFTPNCLCSYVYTVLSQEKLECPGLSDCVFHYLEMCFESLRMPSHLHANYLSPRYLPSFPLTNLLLTLTLSFLNVLGQWFCFCVCCIPVWSIKLF